MLMKSVSQASQIRLQLDVVHCCVLEKSVNPLKKFCNMVSNVIGTSCPEDIF